MSDDALREGVIDMLLEKKPLPSSLAKEAQQQVVEKHEELVEEAEQGDDILEQLANYAHNTWSKWMEYLFEKSTIDKDGSVIIPKDLVERWQRQIGTDYVELSEEEKESDRKEAQKIMEIVGERKVRESKKAPRKDMRKALSEVVENQSKIEVENLSTDKVEDEIKAMLGTKQRKEIYGAIFYQ